MKKNRGEVWYVNKTFVHRGKQTPKIILKIQCNAASVKRETRRNVEDTFWLVWKYANVQKVDARWQSAVVFVVCFPVCSNAFFASFPDKFIISY